MQKMRIERKLKILWLVLLLVVLFSAVSLTRLFNECESMGCGLGFFFIMGPTIAIIIPTLFFIVYYHLKIKKGEVDILASTSNVNDKKLMNIFSIGFILSGLVLWVSDVTNDMSRQAPDNLAGKINSAIEELMMVATFVIIPLGIIAFIFITKYIISKIRDGE